MIIFGIKPMVILIIIITIIKIRTMVIVSGAVAITLKIVSMIL